MRVNSEWMGERTAGWCADNGLAILAAPNQLGSAPTSLEPRTVLVVDDQECVLEVAQNVLEAGSYCVLTASDGRQALDLFATRLHQIALVLLDLTMPGLSSVDTLVAMRRLRSDVPVILSSGYGAEEALSAFRGLRVDGFLQKPYGPVTLMGHVEQALRHAATVRMPAD